MPQWTLFSFQTFETGNDVITALHIGALANCEAVSTLDLCIDHKFFILIYLMIRNIQCMNRTEFHCNFPSKDVHTSYISINL